MTIPLIISTSDNSAIEGRDSAIEAGNSAIEGRDSAIEAGNSAIENQSSATNDENQVFDTEKLTIADNSRILDTINSAIGKNNYGESTKIKMNQICHSIEKEQIFGNSDIVQIVGCSPSTAREILKKFRKMGVIKEVKGKGKGRYVFIS